MTVSRFGKLGLGIALIVLTAGGAAYATIPGADGVIHACYNPAGILRLVDADEGDSCRGAETAIQWAAAPQECPIGTTLFVGVCIEIGSRAPAIHGDASETCALEGRRLPSAGEMDGVRRIPGIIIDAAGEWTDDLGDITAGFKYAGYTQTSSGVADASDLLAYRCVAGLGD